MSAECRRRDGVRSRGFTLLEVVIGLAIAALALVALFKAGGGGIMAVETAGHVEEAIERARSHLAAAGRAGALALGEQDGDDGGGFRWHSSVRPYVPGAPDADPDAASLAGLYRIDVAVSWEERGRHKTVTLTTLRPPGSG